MIKSKRVELGGHGYYCSVTIPQTALRNALDCLERFASHPGTAAIHDPIYALLVEPEEGEETAIVQVINAQPAHPASAELRAIFAPHLDWPDPDLGAVLARYGPVREADDLVAEVDRRLHSHNETQRILRQQVENLEGDLMVAERSSNAAAALGALVLLFGLVGWAIALGVLDVQWMDAPMPSDAEAASSGRGNPSQGERRPSP